MRRGLSGDFLGEDNLASEGSDQVRPKWEVWRGIKGAFLSGEIEKVIWEGRIGISEGRGPPLGRQRIGKGCRKVFSRTFKGGRGRSWIADFFLWVKRRTMDLDLAWTCTVAPQSVLHESFHHYSPISPLEENSEKERTI